MDKQSKIESDHINALKHEKNNYAIQGVKARTDFLKWNQDEMITRFELEHDEQFLYITFFCKKHSINRATGVVSNLDENTPASFEAVMSIYDILCNTKPNAELSGKWQTLGNLSIHSNFGSTGKDSFTSTAVRFSANLSLLKQACILLGGTESTKADVGFAFDAFPFLPVIFQFWDGDEDFEPRITFLFDTNTLNYIHFETAWYVAGYLLGAIEKTLTQIAL